MKRRKFIKLALFGGASSVVVPDMVLAQPGADKINTEMAGGLYFTKNAPGRWYKKIDSHLPQIEKSSNSTGRVQLRVTTAHGMHDYHHYIVKHTLLDQDFNYITETMFNPLDTKLPVSNFVLEKYSGPIYVLSVCNKHDTWLNLIEV